ncbi:MAG: alpha/beta hydrolase, partial [Burkholderiales bacterium]
MTPTDDPARPRQTTLAHAGLVFDVDVCGPDDGETVLLLHGFPQSRHAWREVLPSLAAAGWRCVAPDQRGYSPGARPVGTDAYRTEALVDDALGLIDAMGAARVHLVGIDWGGQVAWHAASRAPERIASLAVLSRPHPVAFGAALRDDPGQRMRSGHHRTLLAEDAPRRWRRGGDVEIERGLVERGVPPSLAAAHAATLEPPGALEAAIEWYRATAGGLGADTMPPIRMPVLYVWGTEDHTVGRVAAEGTAAHGGPAYRFVGIEGAGHYLPEQVPARVAELLL